LVAFLDEIVFRIIFAFKLSLESSLSEIVLRIVFASKSSLELSLGEIVFVSKLSLELSLDKIVLRIILAFKSSSKLSFNLLFKLVSSNLRIFDNNIKYKITTYKIIFRVIFNFNLSFTFNFLNLPFNSLSKWLFSILFRLVL
jgi:hypothetical protein